MAVTMKRIRKHLPSYLPGEANELPFFLEKKAYQGATGRVYPIPYTDKITNTPVDKVWDMVQLENEYIEVQLLPALGGKIYGAKQKSNQYEFIYANTCVKPAMVGLAGPWVSGGVEFNWPQHHRPTTFMPLEETQTENPDGSKTCWMGETEPFHRMRGMVGITVYPGSSVVEARAVVTNRTDAPLPFMWWNNLAVRVHGQYKATFPPDVQWGSDHDRRAIISFPVMKGIYHTARPFDYGDGVDVTWYPNVKLPTSVMVLRGQSDMDFLGGYDFKADAGTITVSDHYFAPGKKMWTWGDGAFGHAWCANLTDNDDRYIELMTGAYTDNQPDFSYIMPGETKEFRTVWYPIRGIGEAKNANLDGAVSLTVSGDGSVRAGCVTTRPINGAFRLLKGDTILKEITGRADPDHPLLLEAAAPAGTDEKELSCAFADESGKIRIAYRPESLREHAKPSPRTIPPKPEAIESLEELYLHGAHLEQYKHHTFEAEAYYREGLKRDAQDLRCNTGLGRLLLEKGDFVEARKCLTAAVSRLKWRNDNPAEPEAIWHLARLERLEGNREAAYDHYAACAWQYGWKSAALYEMACIDAASGRKERAVAELETSLETNAKHFSARVLLGLLTGRTEMFDRVLEEAPLDAYARFAKWLTQGSPVSAYILSRPQDVIDTALDLSRAGMRGEAARVLEACTAPDMMTSYYLAWLKGEKPREATMKYCFPNRLEDIAVLKVFGDDWRAGYLLGCVYYDRMNYQAAVEAWRRSAARNPDNAPTWRNLAQALWDHMSKRDEARAALEKAHALAPDNARIVFELLQLYKNDGVSVCERLAFLEANESAVRERDDCFLEMIALTVQAGDFEKAQRMLLSKRFNIYEGGEGKLTRLHGWLYTLWADKEGREGNLEKALRLLEQALVYPDNYGEGRHYSAQEAQIYCRAGDWLTAAGRAEEAREKYLKAANQPSQVTDLTYFAALAAEKLGDGERAKRMLLSMRAAGKEKIAHADEYGYFGVGMASPMPYELDVAPGNTAEGLLLEALGAHGLGDENACREAVARLRELDPRNGKLNFYERMKVIAEP